MEEYLLLQEAFEILYNPVQRCNYDLYTLRNPAHLMTPMRWWGRYQECVIIIGEVERIQQEEEIKEEGIEDEKVQDREAQDDEAHNDEAQGEEVYEDAASKLEMSRSGMQLYKPRALQSYTPTAVNKVGLTFQVLHQVLSVRAGIIEAWVSKAFTAIWSHAFSRPQIHCRISY